MMADDTLTPTGPRAPTEAERWFLKQELVFSREEAVKNAQANVYRICGLEPPDGDR